MTTHDSIPLGDLDSSPSAKFDTIGQGYKGRITSMRETQQTNIDKVPLTWPDGSPRMQYVITIEQDNGDQVALYAKGGNFKAETGEGQSMRSAISAAVREAKASALVVGAQLAVYYTGTAKAEPGRNPAKLYTAQYRPATAGLTSVPVDLFSE